MSLLTKLRDATPPPVTKTPEPGWTAPRPQFQLPNTELPDPAGAAAWCYEQHTARRGQPPGPGEGHNDWLTVLTKFWNESGAPLGDALTLALDTAPAGHDLHKIEATVRGIYTRDAANFGQKPYTLMHTNGRTVDGSSQSLPPTFGPTVYTALPDYLQRCCAPFEGHEKAVMLLSTLAVLSGCFSGVGGTYGKRRYGLNLYVFIIAPAASGKGALGWARRLAWPWHKRLTDASRAARAAHDAEWTAYQNAGKAKANLTPPPDVPPPFKLLYLPGNTTAAALVMALSENDGQGIMCETEADTLSGALGNDFGNFSDVLRKAFQHEPLSLLRKTDRQYVELERPALSIVITGTPGQLPALIPTAENGLASRFQFYKFEQAPVWQDVSPESGPPLDPIIDKLGDELTSMIEAMPGLSDADTYPVEITLTSADWLRLNEAGAAGLFEAALAGGGAGASTAFRLGLIAWRIVGLLTVLRCFENGKVPTGTLEADPTDVTTALAIMDTSRAHALAVLETLPTPGGPRSGRYAAKAEQEGRVKELHAQGMSYREIAKQTDIPYRTVGNWLKSQ